MASPTAFNDTRRAIVDIHILRGALGKIERQKESDFGYVRIDASSVMFEARVVSSGVGLCSVVRKLNRHVSSVLRQSRQ